MGIALTTRAFLLALLLAAAKVPAQAQDFAVFVGEWSGAGEMALAGESAQRLRCRLNVTLRDATARIAGRCATAQAGLVFAYELEADHDGGLVARNLDEQPDALPALMAGTFAEARIRLGTEDGARLELAREGPELILDFSGETEEGLAEGSARLSREEGPVAP